ncbi:hypothetical protein ACN47E_010139 [Coniothyrium glycines]
MESTASALTEAPRLPPELLYHVLDQLVSTNDGREPVAFEPSNDITKTLRALTIVSRSTYSIASKYLYSRCIYLHNLTNYARFRRTLELDLQYHPEALEPGQFARNDQLFAEANILQHISSLFVSPTRTNNDSKGATLVRLQQITDVCQTIGGNLKRLALDFHPVHVPRKDYLLLNLNNRNSSIFVKMLKLEELIISYHVLHYFQYPPPNLKRLAVTAQELSEVMDFMRPVSSLETLIFLRPTNLSSSNIDTIFSTYHGKQLDVVLVDVNSNHRTPKRTRSWATDDCVKIWEADVPTSFYGDEDDLVLCDNHIWTHGVSGDLWKNGWRRMASWAEIERRLAGPVHTVLVGT